MTVEFTRRAVADISNIAEYYERNGAPGVGRTITARIDDVIAHVVAWPESGKLVTRTRGRRVMPLVRYPYLVFYEIIQSGTILILHIRHTSRRPWRG